MRKNSEEKPIDIISMEEYLKKRQVVRQPETVWEGWREKSASALKLADIFYLYGELKNSRKLASVIVKARSGQKIETIGEFLEVVKPLFGREREKNGGCNRTFQKI